MGRITAPRLGEGAPAEGDACSGGDPRDSWRVGEERGLADVVVVARPALRSGRPEGRYSTPDLPTLDLRIGACRFTPRVAVVPPGSQLRVSHGDPGLHTFHLYRSEPGGKERSVQNLAAPPGGPPTLWGLDRPGRFHVRSDQVPWMESWIVVVDGPSARTDAEGRFAMPRLEAGDWEISLWHERLGEHRAFVTVPSDGPASLYTEFPHPQTDR